MSEPIQSISPFTQDVFAEREQTSAAELDRILDAAQRAQRKWRQTSVVERAAVCAKFVEAFSAMEQEIAPELSHQMGRPVRFGPGEVNGTCDRARTMIGLAESALADVEPAPVDGFRRFIKREPLGVVVVVPAWNFPYLIAVNAVVPALMAGNAVVMKPSALTLLSGERFATAFEAAGLPKGLFACIHLDHAATGQLVQDARVDYVAFTGSVAGGRAVQRAARERFIGIGLELGGKDPAYVREDADVAFAAENIADGAFFNSGQSCCGIERVYVHTAVYDAFVEAAVEHAKALVLGDPTDMTTTLGPMARQSGADSVSEHISRAEAAGAKLLVDPSHFAGQLAGVPRPGAFVTPQILADVTHAMDLMMEETFGPVFGVMRVSGDDEAVRLMNDSPYGLTASIWSKNVDDALALGQQLETGTVFMNRCDYLDPSLAWVGVKDSGRGCTLSSVGYEHLTRPKSFHFRLP